jgi:hypothetical protein
MTAPTHTHTHPHDHPVLAPSGNATVMLDIGEGVGALVVHTPAALAGIEIELARRGEAVQFVHTEVRERRLPAGLVYAGVYPAVPEGQYTLLDLDGTARCDCTIRSGSVTELRW